MKPTLLRKGDWFTLISGKQFWPLDPRQEEIEITDIAHALSHICRWGGHCRRFYSVAQHSILVSRLGKTLEEKRWGLLHDAAEAYLGDMIRPLKRMMREYHHAESFLIYTIAQRFNLDWPCPPEVQKADEILQATEAAVLMNTTEQSQPVVQAKADRSIAIDHWNPGEACMRFLNEYKKLFVGDKRGNPREKTDGEE